MLIAEHVYDFTSANSIQIKKISLLQLHVKNYQSQAIHVTPPPKFIRGRGVVEYCPMKLVVCSLHDAAPSRAPIGQLKVTWPEDVGRAGRRIELQRSCDK